MVTQIFSRTFTYLPTFGSVIQWLKEVLTIISLGKWLFAQLFYFHMCGYWVILNTKHFLYDCTQENMNARQLWCVFMFVKSAFFHGVELVLMLTMMTWHWQVWLVLSNDINLMHLGRCCVSLFIYDLPHVIDGWDSLSHQAFSASIGPVSRRH